MTRMVTIPVCRGREELIYERRGTAGDGPPGNEIDWHRYLSGNAEFDPDILRMKELCERGDVMGAIRYVDDAIRRRPDSPLLYSHKAVIFADSGRLREAEACCRKAISLDAQCSHAYETMGVTMRRSGRPAEAMSYYNEAVRLYEPVGEPDRHLACIYSNMGTAMADMGRLEDSVRCYDESIKVDPRYAMAYRNKAGSLYKMGRTNEAKDCLAVAVALNPDLVTQFLNPQSGPRR